MLRERGLRLDGRALEDIREVSLELDLYDNATGSASFNIGPTKVVANVYGPFDADREAAGLEVEYHMTAFARGKRRQPTVDERRNREVAELISNCFTQAVLMEQHFGNSIIRVEVRVLADGGGALSAAINAVTLALVDAGIPMRDMLTACTVGIIEERRADGSIETHLAADVNDVEEMRGANLPVAIFPSTREVVGIMLLHPLARSDVLDELLAAGVEGCLKVHHEMATRVRTAVGDAIRSRGVGPR